MKKIHVIATSGQRILTIVCQTAIPKILRENETIKGEWFYKNPDELEEFLNKNPDEIEYFLKGFSYWIKVKWKGFNEHPKRYGKLKRAIKDFSEQLFEEIRGLAKRIAKQVRKVLKSRKAIYHELRKLKNIQGRIPLYENLANVFRTGQQIHGKQKNKTQENVVKISLRKTLRKTLKTGFETMGF